MDVFRIVIKRIFICSWAIPIIYGIFLPLFWIVFGDFKEILQEMNYFAGVLWGTIK